MNPAANPARRGVAANPVRRGVAAIIAGGAATRFGGQVKGLLVVAGRRIVDRQIEALGAVFERIVVVANDRAAFAGLLF